MSPSEAKRYTAASLTASGELQGIWLLQLCTKAAVPGAAHTCSCFSDAGCRCNSLQKNLPVKLHPPPPSQESKTELGKWPLQGFAKAADRCYESVRIFVPATTSVHVLIYSWACKDLAAFTCKFTGQMSLQCLYSLSSCFQKGQRSCARCKRSTT